jgi:SAM-dependent methyltransferase
MTLIQDIAKYWNTRPCNLRHSKAKIGTKKYFDQVEERRYTIEPHNYRFAEFYKWKNKKVLEIGCGIGTDAVNFARAGAAYTGIDLSVESVNLCKKRFELYELKGNILTADAERLHDLFRYEKFDLIYSYGVIHHSPNPPKIIDGIKNLLSPDGELRIMLYAKNSWKNFMIDAGLDQPEAQDNCPLAFTYTHDEVKELLKDFGSIEIVQDFIFPWQIKKYVNYEYVKQPWFEAMPPEMFKVLEKNLGWHLLIKATL